MTNEEKKRMQMIQSSIGDVSDTVKEAFGEGPLPDGGVELVIGTMLATIDALFAIRDGEPWRGIIDPQEIAHRLLREAHLGIDDEIEES